MAKIMIAALTAAVFSVPAGMKEAASFLSSMDICRPCFQKVCSVLACLCGIRFIGPVWRGLMKRLAMP